MAGNGRGGEFPDLPAVPPLPHLRPQNATPNQILSECASVLRAAKRSVHQVENSPRPGYQLADIRAAVVDIRRVTFVLQTLSSRVDDFDDWYMGVQGVLRAEPLMGYFVELRNEIEKRGLPGAVAELYNVDTGIAIADVACFEDEYGLAVSGAVREGVDLPSGEIGLDVGLRNFRLPDPPTVFKGQPLDDFRFSTLAGLALDLLESEVVEPAFARFGERPTKGNQ